MYYIRLALSIPDVSRPRSVGVACRSGCDYCGRIFGGSPFFSWRTMRRTVLYRAVGRDVPVAPCCIMWRVEGCCFRCVEFWSSEVFRPHRNLTSSASVVGVFRVRNFVRRVEGVLPLFPSAPIWYNLPMKADTAQRQAARAFVERWTFRRGSEKGESTSSASTRS